MVNRQGPIDHIANGHQFFKNILYYCVFGSVMISKEASTKNYEICGSRGSGVRAGLSCSHSE